MGWSWWLFSQVSQLSGRPETHCSFSEQAIVPRHFMGMWSRATWHMRPSRNFGFFPTCATNPDSFLVHLPPPDLQQSPAAGSFIFRSFVCPLTNCLNFPQTTQAGIHRFQLTTFPSPGFPTTLEGGGIMRPSCNFQRWPQRPHLVFHTRPFPLGLSSSTGIGEQHHADCREAPSMLFSQKPLASCFGKTSNYLSFELRKMSSSGV